VTITIRITPEIAIDESEITERFIRASGPGGQNVNKVSTKAELRFYLARSKALTPARKARLRARFPSHVTTGGEFLLASTRFRSQHRNQEDVFERLREMILSIWQPPKPRLKTKLSKAAKRRRLDDKSKRGNVKRQRSTRDFD
jgi:ribosome-associated protein